MAVEELQAQKLQIEAEMEEMVKRVKKAEEVYMKSIRRTKSNSRWQMIWQAGYESLGLWARYMGQSKESRREL